MSAQVWARHRVGTADLHGTADATGDDRLTRVTRLLHRRHFSLPRFVSLDGDCFGRQFRGVT